MIFLRIKRSQKMQRSQGPVVDYIQTSLCAGVNSSKNFLLNICLLKKHYHIMRICFEI